MMALLRTTAGACLLGGACAPAPPLHPHSPLLHLHPSPSLLLSTDLKWLPPASLATHRGRGGVGCEAARDCFEEAGAEGGCHRGHRTGAE